ncbi:MAG TPA: hypothetical protein VMV84_06675 [Dehalococcoidales bacterium]|nr:hypothetical protein [Dehalococcoidales bacterium]
MPRGKVHNISLATWPEVLTVAVGDTVRVTTEFDYVGPELKDARMISAIWHPTAFDPHNEIVRGNKTFTIPGSPPPGNHISLTIDLLVPSGEIGTDYGLYSSIRDIPGADIYTPYHRNIITIEEVVPEYKGTISKKELEYNETQKSIPVSNVPQGKRGLVHVWGRNNMPTSQKLGIHWIVRDPNGLIAEDYQDWEFGSTSPGDAHEFIGGRFDLNKTGNWTIGISLSMNPDSPLTVASYSGALCTVGAAPPVEYTLEVTIEPPGAGNIAVSPRKDFYSAGEVVKLTAYSYSGYEFDHWGGWPPYPGIGSTSTTIQITMNANLWVVGAFREAAPPGQCSLSVSASPSAGGSVKRSPDKSLYDDGEMVDVTATANPGWTFDKFTGDGWETGANPVHVRGCQTTSVTAHFIQ